MVAHAPVKDELTEAKRKQLLEEFKGTVFRETLGGTPPSRGPFGEATIEIKPGFVPAKQRPFQVVGERREAMIKLIQQLEREGKVERGVSSWCSPAFPVAKKNPGEYRLVIDYRKRNDATMPDGHPLPRIEEILIRQGKYKMWTVLDMKDAFHQMPMKKESRHFTCMSTPLGVYQWVAMPMGLTNAPSIFFNA